MIVRRDEINKISKYNSTKVNEQYVNNHNGKAKLVIIDLLASKLPLTNKGRTQCRELPLCAGSGEGCQWQALPSPVQCKETATRTRDLPVTGGKTLPLAPGPPFRRSLSLSYQNLETSITLCSHLGRRAINYARRQFSLVNLPADHSE